MASHPSISDRFSVTSQALFERVQGEGFILDTRAEIYFGLNGTGVLVWESLAQGNTLEEAAERLTQKYGISKEQAMSDAAALVHELLQRRLLERSM
jgi:hypothetical protein